MDGGRGRGKGGRKSKRARNEWGCRQGIGGNRAETKGRRMREHTDAITCQREMPLAGKHRLSAWSVNLPGQQGMNAREKTLENYCPFNHHQECSAHTNSQIHASLEKTTPPLSHTHTHTRHTRLHSSRR